MILIRLDLRALELLAHQRLLQVEDRIPCRNIGNALGHIKFDRVNTSIGVPQSAQHRTADGKQPDQGDQRKKDVHCAPLKSSGVTVSVENVVVPPASRTAADHKPRTATMRDSVSGHRSIAETRSFAK